MLRSAFTAALALTAAPVVADEPARLLLGDVVMKVAAYYVDSSSFGPPRPGEDKACFQVTKLTRDEVTLTLIGGTYHPWWSDEAIPLGTADVWSNDPFYLEKHPDTAPLDFTRQLFRTVGGCPVA